MNDITWTQRDIWPMWAADYLNNACLSPWVVSLRRSMQLLNVGGQDRDFILIALVAAGLEGYITAPRPT